MPWLNSLLNLQMRVLLNARVDDDRADLERMHDRLIDPPINLCFWGRSVVNRAGDVRDRSADKRSNDGGLLGNKLVQFGDSRVDTVNGFGD